MDGIKDRLFPSSPVEAVIRFRPLSLALFRRLGVNPWENLKVPLEMACGRRGGDAAVLLRELQSLHVPGPDTPWRERPAYFLIDHLTGEHRDFLHKDLPAIRYLLAMGPPREGGGEAAFETLAFAVEDFARRIGAHTAEEEEEIFPAILRNEHMLGGHHGPEENGPSDERAPAASRLIDSDGALMKDLESLLEGSGRGFKDIRPQGRAEPGSDHGAWPLLRGLFRRLTNHARLETEVLFPMAARMERELHAVIPA